MSAFGGKADIAYANLTTVLTRYDPFPAGEELILA